jgi:hypothetical protein
MNAGEQKKLLQGAEAAVYGMAGGRGRCKNTKERYIRSLGISCAVL